MLVRSVNVARELRPNAAKKALDTGIGAFRALMGERELFSRLLDAGDYLIDELRESPLVV